MLDSNKFLLLKVLYLGEDIDPLVERGLNYAQIAELLTSLISDGYLEKSKDEIILTEKGLMAVQKDDNKFNVNKDKWIKEEFDSKIESISVLDIYLPRKDDIDFE